MAGDPAALRGAAGLLGFLGDNLGGWDAAPAATPEIEARVAALLAARLEARRARDFARADALRDGLVAAGVAVKDTPAGAEWSLTPGFDRARLQALE